jgi:hypothetical protein
MREVLLKMTIILLVITISGTSLSLLVGRFTPAEMLSATFRTAVSGGNQFVPDRTNFILIDLHRHIRVRFPMPVEGAFQTVTINQNGQEALIQMNDSRRMAYRYDLMMGTLSEVNFTYNDPETGNIFQMGRVFSWTGSYPLWDYDPQTGAVYRLDVASNTLEYVVNLIDENDPSSERLIANQPLYFSPTRTQIAFVGRHTIYIFNADGSNLKNYANPIGERNSYGYWSQDERYFSISGIGSQAGTTNYLRVLDLNSEEIIPATRNLESASFFNPCGWQNEWVSYVDIEYEAQVLNYQTGETYNLSSLPELTGQSIEQILWLPDCDWVMVTIDIPNDNIRAGLVHQPIYIVSRDGQTVYSLGENVAVLGDWLDSNTFLLAEAQGTEDIVYEVHVDDTLHKNPIGHFTPSGSWMTPLRSDPYHMLVYDNQGSNRYSYVSMLNLRSGAVDTYFAPNEVLTSSPIQWLWD